MPTDPRAARAPRMVEVTAEVPAGLEDAAVDAMLGALDDLGIGGMGSSVPAAEYEANLAELDRLRAQLIQAQAETTRLRQLDATQQQVRAVCAEAEVEESDRLNGDLRARVAELEERIGTLVESRQHWRNAAGLRRQDEERQRRRADAAETQIQQAWNALDDLDREIAARAQHPNGQIGEAVRQGMATAAAQLRGSLLDTAAPPAETSPSERMSEQPPPHGAN